MQKKGQFYLIAAIVIIAIILGFAIVQNYVRKSDVKIYNLKDELGFEGGKVLEYGTFSDDNKIEDFTTLYHKYSKEEGRNLYFAYGNTDTITIATFEEIILGGISITLGEGSPKIKIEGDAYKKKTISVGGETDIIIKIENEQTGKEVDYQFNLKPGENFYFVILQNIGEETYIA